VTAASFDPIRPVPPMTTISISVPFDFVMCDVCWLFARKVDEVGQDSLLEGPPISGAANSWYGACRGGGRCSAHLTPGRLALLLGGSTPRVVEVNGLRVCPGR
jgi:hypothetical protein